MHTIKQLLVLNSQTYNAQMRIILQNLPVHEIYALIWSMIITNFHIPSFLNTCKSNNIKGVTNNPKLYYIYSNLYKTHLYIWQILVKWIK